MFFCFTGKFCNLLPVFFHDIHFSILLFILRKKRGQLDLREKRRSQSSARSQNFRLFSRFSCTFPVIRICAGAIFMLFLLMYHFFHSITLNMPGQEPGTGFFRAEFCRGSVFRISRLREVCALYRIFTLGNSHLQKTTAKLTAKLRFFTVVFFRNKCSIFTGQSNRCVLYSFYEIEQMFLLIFHRLTESGESGC